MLPDANKTNVIGNGVDEVLWENLPVPSHWVTYQLGAGGNNEYDHDMAEASLTFASGRYYIIISADEHEPRLYVIDAREPTPDEMPVFEEPDPDEPIPPELLPEE